VGNETLFEQGAEGDKMFILISGRVQMITYDKAHTPHITNEIKQGELVGELAVISGKKQMAAAVAMRDSILAYISRETYFEIAENFPHHTLYMTNMIIDRLTEKYQANKNLRERWNIALVPITPSVNIADFTNTIKPYLQKHGRTLHLNNDLINEYLGYDNIAQVGRENADLYHKLTFWIDRYEAQYNFIVYEADNHHSEWTQRCLRQADEVIFVANSADSSKLSQLEEQITAFDKNINTHQTLVLLHPPSVKCPSETKYQFARNFIKFNDFIQ
jgi:NTE family protein